MPKSNEIERINNLKAYRVLDTPIEESYERIVAMAALLFQTPIAAISLVDETRQWFKAQVGLKARETPREWSFCSCAIEQEDPVFVVAQPEQDPQFSANPLVTGAPFIRFYAGAPIIDSRGFALGALCVIDTSERPYPTENERAALIELARFTSQQLELERTRRELAEKERILRLAEKMSGVGHWRYDVATGDVTWSDEIFRFFGMEPSEKPLSFAEVLKAYPAEDRKRVEESVANAIATGRGYSLQRTVLGHDGVTRTTRSSTVCESGPDGEVVALFGVFQDITDHVAAQHAAEAANHAKSEFLANMSHELRTPLTSVVGYAGLLRDVSALDGEARYYVDQVLAASNALMATINDILDFSLVESGQITLDLQPVNAIGLFDEVISLFGPQAGTKGLTLSRGTPAPIPGALILDGVRVRQILINLIGNAVKFTQTGAVTLRAEFDADAIKVDVTDTGPGIAEEQIGRLFKRFSQVDGSASRTSGGSGLGLAICKGLLDAMGGSIEVTSMPDQGSTFSFTIPTREAVAEINPLNAAQEKVSFRGYSVLLVDGDEVTRELVKDVLCSRGATVVALPGLEEAQRHDARGSFDLVLLDTALPGMNARSVRSLRGDADPGFGIPVIALTTDTGIGVQIAHAPGAAGFDDAIVKPVLPASLTRAAAHALGITTVPVQEVA